MTTKITQPTIIATDTVEIKQLENPFHTGDKIKLPAGTAFVTTRPNKDGEQLTKRNQSVEIFGVSNGDIDPYFTKKTKRTDVALYENDRQTVLVGSPSITLVGTGGYWKYVKLTEEIILFNGMEPKYDVIGTMGKDSFFRRNS